MQHDLYHLCRPHRAGHRGCLAVSVARRIQRRGFAAGQYQGVVKTQAPPELVNWQISETKERIQKARAR